MSKASETKLAKIWCKLNSYDWPSELGEMPSLWTGNRDVRHKIAITAMKAIEIAIPMKIIDAEWQKSCVKNDKSYL